jgi:nitrate reductase NapD
MTNTGDSERIGNICGVIVHVAPGRSEDVSRTLAAMPGVEVHAGAGDGRLVITVEDTSEITAAQGLLAVNALPGVVNAALVYHHYEPDSDEPGSVAKEA